MANMKVGTITKEQIFKMNKKRSTDYVMPKTGFHESKKYNRRKNKAETKRMLKDW